MNKIVKIVLVGVTTLFLLTGCGSSEENREKLYVGTNAEFPPFEYKSNNEVVGFDIDLIKEIGLLLDKEIVISDFAFDGLLPALQTKKVDIVIAGMTATDERKKSVSFSHSYYKAKQVIISREKDVFNSFDELSGHKVGVILGFTGDIVASDIDGVDVMRYNSAYNAILDLKSSKVDAVVLDSEPGYNFVKNNTGLSLQDIKAAEEDYAIALRKDDKELTSKINDALETLKENGTYDKLIEKHFKN